MIVMGQARILETQLRVCVSQQLGASTTRRGVSAGKTSNADRLLTRVWRCLVPKWLRKIDCRVEAATKCLTGHVPTDLPVFGLI